MYGVGAPGVEGESARDFNSGTPVAVHPASHECFYAPQNVGIVPDRSATARRGARNGSDRRVHELVQRSHTGHLLGGTPRPCCGSDRLMRKRMRSSRSRCILRASGSNGYRDEHSDRPSPSSHAWPLQPAQVREQDKTDRTTETADYRRSSSTCPHSQDRLVLQPDFVTWRCRSTG